MYGILISTAIIVSSLTAERIAKKQRKNLEILWQGLIIIIIVGVLGARLYHVIDYWCFYQQYPLKTLAIWNGGLGIYGGVLGAATAFVVYLKRQKEPVLEWLDIAGLVTPLGQAIGRWGNYFNRELLPYAIYESVFDLLLFLMLLLLWKQKMYEAKGVTFFSYLMGYGLIRFFLEFLRVDPWEIHKINVAQGLSIVLILGAALSVRYLILKKRPAS